MSKEDCDQEYWEIYILITCSRHPEEKLQNNFDEKRPKNKTFFFKKRKKAALSNKPERFINLYYIRIN